MFNSVRSNKVSENIVEQIRKAIFEGTLKPGNKLSPEKELMKNFNVSKTTLREAMRSLEVLGFLEIKRGVLGGAIVTEIDMKKARDCFANFLHFKNLSLTNLTEVRLVLESHIAEKAALTITEDDLKGLKKLIEECEYVLKHDTPIESRKNEIEFHRIIGNAMGNPILMFILDFVDNLLIETKAILKPGKEFSNKVLRAHKRIYKALLERDAKKVRKEMVKHIREVEKDLLTAHKEKHNEEQKFDRFGRKKEFISIFSMRP